MHLAAISGIVDVDGFGAMLDAVDLTMTYSMLTSVVENHTGGCCAMARATTRDFSGGEVRVRLSACHFGRRAASPERKGRVPCRESKLPIYSGRLPALPIVCKPGELSC